MTWKLSDAKLASREEVERLIKAAKKEPWFYLFLVVAANTGLRLCEVLHLKAKDVGKSGLTIIRRKKRQLVKELLPVSNTLAKLLMERVEEVRGGWLWPGRSRACSRTLHLSKRRNGRVVKRWVEHQDLCTGGHLHKREIQRRWRLIVDQLGIYRTGFGIHSLRHYAGTEFYASNKDLRATQVMLGHSSSTITEVYSHVVDLEEQIKKVRPVV